MDDTTCRHCGAGEDTRPYGPGGTWICFPCMKATIEREETAQNAFAALLDAAIAISPIDMAIATSDGPQPFNPERKARR